MFGCLVGWSDVSGIHLRFTVFLADSVLGILAVKLLNSLSRERKNLRGSHQLEWKVLANMDQAVPYVTVWFHCCRQKAVKRKHFFFRCRHRADGERETLKAVNLESHFLSAQGDATKNFHIVS